MKRNRRRVSNNKRRKEKAWQILYILQRSKKSAYVKLTWYLILKGIFNANGTNTYPTNWKVYNNSELGAVRLKLVELEQRNDWELVGETTDITANTHDTKEIKFYMGVPNKLRIFAPYSGGGSKMSFEEGYEVVIPAGGSQQFDFKIERGAFKTALAEHIAFDLVLTFEYN